MKHIFYFTAIFPILFELYVLYNPLKTFNFRKRIKKVKVAKDYNTDQTLYVLLQLAYFIWAFAGILTSQWVLFSTLIFISFIPKKYLVLMMLDSIISIFLILFIMFNAYHFHIDIWAILYGYFNK